MCVAVIVLVSSVETASLTTPLTVILQLTNVMTTGTVKVESYSTCCPVTVIFLVITLFDVNLTSGAMYSFIFYSQILNSQFNNVYTIIQRENKWPLRYTLEFFKMIYGIFDFEILENAYMLYCVLPRATVMDILLLKYALTFYAFFLIVAIIIILKLNSFYACIKFCHKCGRRNIRGSVINGLNAFLVLSYYRCLVITLKIIFFSRILSRILSRTTQESSHFITGI